MLNTRLLYVGKKADFPVPLAVPWSGSRIGWGCEPPPQLLRVHLMSSNSYWPGDGA